jgi:Trp operon repressor
MTAISERLTAALADRYRIERELGAGGMATVCLAEDLGVGATRCTHAVTGSNAGRVRCVT